MNTRQFDLISRRVSLAMAILASTVLGVGEFGAGSAHAMQTIIVGCSGEQVETILPDEKSVKLVYENCLCGFNAGDVKQMLVEKAKAYLKTGTYPQFAGLTSFLEMAPGEERTHTNACYSWGEVIGYLNAVKDAAAKKDSKQGQ